MCPPATFDAGPCLTWDQCQPQRSALQSSVLLLTSIVPYILGKASFLYLSLPFASVFVKKGPQRAKKRVSVLDACQENVTPSHPLPKVKAKKCSSRVSSGSLPPRDSTCRTATQQASTCVQSDTGASTGSRDKLEYLARL